MIEIGLLGVAGIEIKEGRRGGGGVTLKAQVRLRV